MGKRKKGMSMEEKVKKMAEIFSESQKVYDYKEIEKLSLKKGISYGSIKAVLQEVLNDNFATSDKVG